jgi:hypothetical protein
MDVCNIRTTLVPAPGRFPKYMEAQRFVSKNDWIEKMDRTGIMQIAGNMILYSPNRGKQAQDPHLFVTLPPINPGYISALGASRAGLCAVRPRLRRKKTQKQH